VKKMHGLNVEQYTCFGTIDHPHAHFSHVNVTDPNQGHSALVWYFSPCRTSHLARIDPILANVNTEVYMKRCYVSSTVTNHLTVPIIVEVTKLWTRLDLTSVEDPLVIGQEAAPTWDNAYYSITTGHTFQNTFKIMSTKRYTVRGGKSIHVKTSKNKWAGSITGRVEGDSSFHIRKNMPYTVIRVYGCPMPLPSGPAGLNGMCLGPFYASLLQKYYYSYYTMSDAIPTSAEANFNGILPRIPYTMGSGLSATGVRTPLDVVSGYPDSLTGPGLPKGPQLQSTLVETS